MQKRPFITKEKAQEIIEKFPTPFHIYDEKGIRENARRLKEAFSWNKGFREYFASGKRAAAQTVHHTQSFL